MMRIIRWIDCHLEEALLVTMLLGMTVVMGVQVFFRFVIGTSLSWTEELTRYLFIWSGFLSVSYCISRGISIRIEQLAAALPRNGELAVRLISFAAELFFFIYMIPFAYSYMMSAVESGQVSPALGLPMYYVQAAPLVSFVLAAFRIIQKWTGEIRGALCQ